MPRMALRAFAGPRMAVSATNATVAIIKRWDCMAVFSLEVPALLAFIKLGSVKITAFSLPAVLSVACNGFCGGIIKDLIPSLHGLFTAGAN